MEHLVGLDTAKVSIGLLLTALYIPMLFMGEEWATSAPFLYFADHEDEEMRQLVAEGRKKEFAVFGFDGDIPNPEDQKTYEMSKLKWDEQAKGKHAEMLAWMKALIRLRRSRVCFNDGDMHHLEIFRNDQHRTLIMVRDEARVIINLGKDNQKFSLLDGENIRTRIARRSCRPRQSDRSFCDDIGGPSVDV